MPTEIVDGLVIGGRQGYEKGFEGQGFDLVVCAEDHLRAETLGRYDGMVIGVPMVDSEDFDPDPLQCNIAADAVVEYVNAGKRAFIHCAAGVNRTGVIAALALTKLGYNPEEAVALLDEKRPGSLNNQHFREFVLGE
jgi:protein-tyrosine phosphatase